MHLSHFLHPLSLIIFLYSTELALIGRWVGFGTVIKARSLPCILEVDAFGLVFRLFLFSKSRPQLEEKKRLLTLLLARINFLF